MQKLSVVQDLHKKQVHVSSVPRHCVHQYIAFETSHPMRQLTPYFSRQLTPYVNSPHNIVVEVCCTIFLSKLL